MTTARSRLRESLRTLLLPMRPDREGACGRGLRSALAAEGIIPDDFLRWITLRKQEWVDKGEAPVALRRVVRKVLERADATIGPTLAESYFDIHEGLLSSHHLSHAQATALLTHALLIGDLANLARSSAAQIAQVLSVRDPPSKASRRTVSEILRGLEALPGFTTRMIEHQFNRDSASEPAILSDAGIITSTQIVSEAARSLGFTGDISLSLTALAPPSELGAFVPYLQMLHYQAAIAEFIDHTPTDIYEFSPRGVRGEWLFANYPVGFAEAGNPFLNNAKAVERLTESWARSKKEAQYPAARALVEVLAGLEIMGFAARRELARYLRIWLHRILRFTRAIPNPVPAALTAAQIDQLLKFVSDSNTKTFGILEQRLLDAVGVLRFTAAQGWRPRGIGDAVNATNVSRRKLGDIDFQHPANRVIEAFEAHGGTVTQAYLEGHLFTVRKILPLRLDELEGVEDRAAWNIRVTLLGHDIEIPPHQDVMIDDVTLHVSVTTFADFLEGSQTEPDIAQSIATHVLQPLRERRTPSEVRDALLAVI